MTRYTRIIAARKARPYDPEVFATHAYWHDGAIVCGCCDAPVYNATCDGCEIAFVDEPPVEPVLTYGERRQAHFDAHTPAAEDVLRLIRRDLNAAVIL